MTARCIARIAASVVGLTLPQFCLAAADGELWEVSSQMSMPGMPAGMAGMAQAPQRICNTRNAREDATRANKDCKIAELKETGTRVTMTLTCPQGRMVIDQTYNAARTEYKSSMKMTSKDGDMVINSTGRKIGTCDVQQAKKAREEKTAAMVKEGERQQAAANRQLAEHQKQTAAALNKSCSEAATAMDPDKFPGQLCYRKNDPVYGATSAPCTNKEVFEMSVPKEAKSFCDARRTEFCKKLPTEAAFALSARGIENGAALCGQQPQKLVSTLCGRALQTEAYRFLGRHCPAEAKPLFTKNCAGRDYTSLPDKKVRNMCSALARLDDGDERPASSGSAPKAATEAKKPTATERAEKGISEGVNKLRGLFGR